MQPTPRRGIVGFGGRILDSGTSDAPKYLNSPDTQIFDKGRTLYNLDRAAPLARKSGRLVVVEGYMDVVALADAGIEEAVAPLGTALTEAQLELAWRVCPTPVLCFDGDPAGQRAALRAIARALPLLAPSQSLAIARLPAGLDPDDLLKAAQVDGAGAWTRLWRIIIPLMKPAILVALLFRTLDAFRIFDNVFIMTNGANGTEVLSLLAYRQAITRLEIGMGSAISVLLFLCVLLICFIAIKLFKVDLAGARGEK